MRTVIQRVTRARVRVGGELIAEIGKGFLALTAAGKDDTGDDARWLARKVAGLRIFDDGAGKMNLSLQEAGGEVLAVSQFTLYADCSRGRRPSFTEAMEPAQAERLFDLFVEELRQAGVECRTGRFRAVMEVELVNDGPVTVIMDSDEAPAGGKG